MKTRMTLIAAAAAALASFGAGAQTNKELLERIEQLELKQKDSVVAGDIGGGLRLPGSETTLRLYGYAEAHLIKDFKATPPNDIFTDLTFQPLDSSGAQKGKTKMTAESSRFGIETATPTAKGTFATKIEADFYAYSAGNRNRLRLRHAYGEYAGFLVGQTWSTFMDLDDLPETVDFNGPIGSPFSRRTMIRYTYADPNIAKFTVALEDPEDQAGLGSANERTPQFVARVDKSFDWGALNLRFLSHEKRVATSSKRGTGIGFGGSWKVTDKDLLMGQFARVEGDVDQQYGSNGYTVDANGNLVFDKSNGVIVGWAKTFSDQLRGNLVFGANRNKQISTINDNRTLRQLFINLIYSPIKNVELGVDLIEGKRKTFAGETGTMSRIDLMGRYSF